MVDYDLLAEQLAALVGGVPHLTANLANASALIFDALDDINWAGFYLLDGEKLILGPFQGKPACIEIPIGRGVCGAAVERGSTVLVADVHSFKGHIACDSASRSEVVVPLFVGGKCVGVLDVDSPTLARFDEKDAAGLEKVARVLESELTDFLTE